MLKERRAIARDSVVPDTLIDVRHHNIRQSRRNLPNSVCYVPRISQTGKTSLPMYAAFRRIPVIAGLAWLALAAAASAQTTDGDPTNAKMHFGPLLMTPSIAVTNIGIDTNVFYEPGFADPKQDFTLTMTPRADLWLRAGRTLFSAFVKEDLVWYRTYASERSANESAAVTWRVPLDGSWRRPATAISTRASGQDSRSTHDRSGRSIPPSALSSSGRRQKRRSASGCAASR